MFLISDGTGTEVLLFGTSGITTDEINLYVTNRNSYYGNFNQKDSLIGLNF